MRLRKIVIFFSVSVLITDIAFAQVTPVRSDTTKLYKDIESYSKGSKFKTFLYRLIFKPVSVISKKSDFKTKPYKNLIQKPYSTFQGKVIRKIDIVALDPFGYSITDSTVRSQNIVSNAANDLHVKTQVRTIRNLLLIRENEPFNSYFVKESERLIRNQKFVHDVSFYVAFSGKKSDSVDIFIRELDIWSMIPSGSISPSQIKLGLDEKNFIGTGHEFQNIYSRNITTRINSFNTTYFIPNIRTSYINSRLHYGIDGYGNYSRSLSIDRPFYSPYAKWAAGISFATQVKKDSLINLNPFYVPLNLKFNTQDYWAGKAIQIFKGSTEEDHATNLILAMRYLRIRYKDKPADLIDSLHIYSNENFYLTGIGISTRRYVQDKYIFNYGTIEDVPVGRVYGLTLGYQIRNGIGRPYLGLRYSFGNYNSWGYLSSDFEYGVFFHSSHSEQGVFIAGINYFSGIFEIGKWKFRQFIKPQIAIGINRFAYDSLTLNDGYGLDGFNSTVLSGSNRLTFSLQTQSYAPWNVFGFHFGPFLTYSFGMLGEAITGFKRSKVYSQFGFGVLIKNLNLIFDTFQVSFSFYPIIPGRGQNVFKINSFRTTDFGFRDFEIERPAPMVYR